MSETRFNQVAPAFAAKDYEMLVRFYEDVMGLEATYKTDDYAVLNRGGGHASRVSGARW